MRLLAVLMTVFFFIPSAFAQTSNETLTITTYYPAPYGVYRNLRLHPSDEPTTGVDTGVMYYNNTTDSIRYYNKSGTWVNLTGGAGGTVNGTANGWEYNISTGHVYNVNSGNIGIGTRDPHKKLSVIGIENGSASPAEQPLVYLEGDGNVQLYIRSASDTQSSEPEIITRRSRGTIASPLPVQTHDELLELHGKGYMGGSDWGTAGQMYVRAAGLFTSTSSPGYIGFETTPVNSLNPAIRMMIGENGNVRIGGAVTTSPTAKLEIGGTPGVDGIRFPDGTLQTTAAVSGGSALSDCVTIPVVVTVNWSNGFATCPAGYYVTGCTGSTGFQTTVYHAVFNGNGCVSIGGSATAGQTVGYARCCK